MKIRLFKGSFIVLSLSLLLGLWGCGDDSAGTKSDFATLSPYLQALNDRVDSHHEYVQGIFEYRSKVPDSGPSEEDWDALHEEHSNYDNDMHGYLDVLGNMVTHIGNCQMWLGGMMYGPHGTNDTCPCQSYMNEVIEELDHHLSEMLSWMELHDLDGLLGEMNRHMEQIGIHLLEMREHMQQLYGHSHHHSVG